MGTKDPSMDCFYIPIADALKAVGTKVHLFGVVAGVGPPRRSKGTDYVITLRIIDQSHSSPGISVNFFSEEPKNLPYVRSIGDMISLHRIVIKVHDGEFYGAFNKKFSSYALFEAKPAAGFSHYQATTKYHASSHDEKFISRLRAWFFDLSLTADLEEQSLPMRRIKTNLDFNLVCKVLHVFETSESKSVLFVWDGTDTPPASFENDLELEGEAPCPIDFEGLSLSIEVLRGFPSVGSVLRVFTGKSYKEMSHLQANNRWVKLCNITCELQSGFWKVMLRRSSEVHTLSDQDWIVRRRLKAYNSRLESEVERHPLASFPSPCHITVLNYEHKAYATLRESITYKKVTHKCMCIVRVVAAYPFHAKDLRSPVNGIYRVRLTLEDPTARIHAYVCGEEGVKFFNGYPTSDVLTSNMNKLLGITDLDGQAREDHCRDPPWIWCCLKSYYLNESDRWRSRRYQIFDTTLIG